MIHKIPQPELDRRSRSILLETLNEFVLTAEPVSSRTISRKLEEKLSPATVRNVMADLEELGFLTQPHTSAGRVPTDQGYRYFVNEILRVILDRPNLFQDDLFFFDNIL